MRFIHFLHHIVFAPGLSVEIGPLALNIVYKAAHSYVLSVNLKQLAFCKSPHPGVRHSYLQVLVLYIYFDVQVENLYCKIG